MEWGGDSVTMKNYEVDWYDYDNSKDFLTALTVEQSCNQYPVNGSKVLRLSIPANYIITFASTTDNTTSDSYSSMTPNINSRLIKFVVSDTNQTVCAGYKPFINKVQLYRR